MKDEQCGGRPCVRGMRIRVVYVRDLVLKTSGLADVLRSALAAVPRFTSGYRLNASDQAMWKRSGRQGTCTGPVMPSVA